MIAGIASSIFSSAYLGPGHGGSKLSKGHSNELRVIRNLFKLGKSLSSSAQPWRKLITIGEGWNADRLVNRKICLPAQLSPYHNSPIQRPYYC